MAADKSAASGYRPEHRNIGPRKRRGVLPARARRFSSVVVSGNLPSHDGKYSLYCAVIVKRVGAKIRAKTSINELHRGD
jgi:2,3,4,5-tetrahydropyridine-2,6-dicarboxylate N-succinyltransferase